MIKSGVNCINLPVYTVSGKHLGRVVGVEVEPKTQAVVRYQVSSVLPLVHLWGEKLLVSAEQVVRISDESVVVEDAVISLKTVAVSEKKSGLVPEPSA